MRKQIVCLILSAYLCGTSSQTSEQHTSQYPLNYYPKAELLTNTNSEISKTDLINDKQLEELLPTLQMIKNTSKHKREKLYKAIKTLKSLLIDDDDEIQLNETVTETKPEITPVLHLETSIEEKPRVTKEISNENKCLVNETEVSTATVNKTTDVSGILSKINNAITKSRTPIPTPAPNPAPAQMIPIFKPKNGYKSEILPNPLENSAQSENSINQAGNKVIPSTSAFNIPCQKASDILEETVNFVIPKEAICDLPVEKNMNLNSIDVRFNSEKPKDNDIVPNSVSCVDLEETVAILFKPKLVTFMQVYGNLLKKITLTVLVPYYASKVTT